MQAVKLTWHTTINMCHFHRNNQSRISRKMALKQLCGAAIIKQCLIYPHSYCVLVLILSTHHGEPFKDTLSHYPLNNPSRHNIMVNHYGVSCSSIISRLLAHHLFNQPCNASSFCILPHILKRHSIQRCCFMTVAPISHLPITIFNLSCVQPIWHYFGQGEGTYCKARV